MSASSGLVTVLLAVALLWLAAFNIMLVRYAGHRLTAKQRRAAVLILVGIYGLWVVAAVHFRV